MKRDFKNRIMKDPNILKLKKMLQNANFDKDNVPTMLLAF